MLIRSLQDGRNEHDRGDAWGSHGETARRRYRDLTSGISFRSKFHRSVEEEVASGGGEFAGGKEGGFVTAAGEGFGVRDVADDGVGGADDERAAGMKPFFELEAELDEPFAGEGDELE